MTVPDAIPAAPSDVPVLPPLTAGAPGHHASPTNAPEPPLTSSHNPPPTPTWQITPDEQASLHAVAARILDHEDLTATLTALVGWAMVIVDGTCAIAALGAPAADATLGLAVHAALGRDAPTPGDIFELPPDAVEALFAGHPHRRLDSGAATIAVPIGRPGRFRGALFVIRPPDRPFSEPDAQLLQLLALQAAIAVDQDERDRRIAHLYHRERFRAEQLRTVAEVGQQIIAIRDLNDLLPFIAAVTRSHLGYDTVAIYLVDAVSSELVLRAASGRADQPPLGARLAPDARAIPAWAHRAGEPQLVNNLAAIELEPHRAVAPYTAGAELAVPIVAPDGPVGVLDVRAPDPGAFDEADLSTLQALAGGVASAILNARLDREQRERATAEERHRLARELHDETAQDLIAIARQVELARADLADPARADTRLGELLDLVDTTLAQVRRISQNLRPRVLEDLGLVAAVEAVAADVDRQTQLAARFRLVGDPRRLHPDAELALFRVAQEAVANVIKHAGARSLEIELAFEPDAIALAVADDGRGLPPGVSLADLERRGGMGFSGMRERAAIFGGTLEVDRAAAGGARIHVRLPL